MTLTFRALLAIGIVVLGAGCAPKSAAVVAEVPAKTTTVDYETTVGVVPGEVVRLSRTNSSFTFIGVASDNRCPRGVNCVQAGEAVVRIGLPDGGVRRVTVGGGEKQRSRFSIPGGIVEIMALNPYPEYENNIAPQDYRLRLKITPAAAM